MSGIQRFLTSILPSKWAADMEAESRSWMVQCPSCGHARSVWELGGIRWKAAGSPRRYMRCPQCGEAGWHTIARAN
jgi:predicted RNA-binding Zn-ribbon protein involved in translation (DUF1610 family)